MKKALERYVRLVLSFELRGTWHCSVRCLLTSGPGAATGKAGSSSRSSCLSPRPLTRLHGNSRPPQVMQLKFGVLILDPCLCVAALVTATSNNTKPRRAPVLITTLFALLSHCCRRCFVA